MNTIELIHEASSLSVDERARIIDSLLQTLNPVDDENAAKWVEMAHRRLEEIDSGQVQTISGDQVFARLRQRLADE